MRRREGMLIPLFIKLVLPLCIYPTGEMPSDISLYSNCLNNVKKIEYVIEWEPLISKHFKEEDVAEVLTIIYCESSGRPNAVNDNTNGTRDVGLFQFNDDTWAWLAPKLKITSPRTDPVISTKVASWLWYNDGKHHWYSSGHCWRNDA